MKKNDLLMKEGELARVLEVREGQVLVIDCRKQAMPTWDDEAAWGKAETVPEKGLGRYLGGRLDEVPCDEPLARKRFSMIASILPVVADRRKRNRQVSMAAEQYGCSKQTIREYLCRYLAWQDVRVLAPVKKQEKKELTADQKNMRWALNKYFYNRYKCSLVTAYLQMLKEKYTDGEIFRLRELGMSYPMIGRTMGASINVVKPIGERRYVSSGGVKHYRRKPGAKEKDWATLDEEMLPRIKEIIDELEGDGISRPRRVKVHTVQMKAGLKAKALQKMPQCLELVVKHRQPLEVYWAKEIAWAVKDVDRTGDPWQWTSIRRRTNMKRRDLKACLPCFMFWTERSIIFNVLAETWNGWVNSRGSRILFGHHNVSGFISVRENSRRRLASSFASGGMF